MVVSKVVSTTRGRGLSLRCGGGRPLRGRGNGPSCRVAEESGRFMVEEKHLYDVEGSGLYVVEESAPSCRMAEKGSLYMVEEKARRLYGVEENGL